MKNWNLWFLSAILAVLYFGHSTYESLKAAVDKNTDTLQRLRAETQGIAVKLQSDEKEKITFYKLQKNLDIWQGTGCAQCHSTLETALPLRRISVTEAIKEILV